MKIGVYPHQLTGDLQHLLRQSHLAEELGYDSVWFAEHHGIPHMLPDPLTAAAAVASVTERVRLGANMIVPFRHPLDLAERGAMVDVLSGGRFVAGFGQGFAPHEFEWFGVRLHERLGRYREGVEAIRRLWEEDSVDFAGRYVSLSGTRAEPRCIQGPRPPIWVMAGSPSAVQRAARLGDAWMAGSAGTLDSVRDRAEIYRKEVGTSGGVAEVAVVRFVFVASSREAAIEKGGRYFYRFFRETYLKWPLPVVGKVDEASYTSVATGRFIAGSPDDVVEELTRWKAEVAPDHVVCYMHQQGSDPADVEASMRFLAQEVLPGL